GRREMTPRLRARHTRSSPRKRIGAKIRCVSRAQRSAAEAFVDLAIYPPAVRCRPGTVTVCGGPRAAGPPSRALGFGVSGRGWRALALHRIRDTRAILARMRASGDPGGRLLRRFPGPPLSRGRAERG